MKKTLYPIAVLLALGLAGAPARAQHSILDQILRAQPSIVSIEAENSGWYKSPQQGAAIDPRSGRMVVVRNVKRASYNRSGAGVIVHPSGVIVTNAHNVKKADRIRVIFNDNTEAAARVVRLVDNIDLALLKIQPPFPLRAIPIADSNAIALGDEIITTGNSPLLKQTVSGGKVIGLGTSRTQKRRGRTRTDLIQTSLNLYKGDSGGPLFDHDGCLVGLLTASETAADHSSFAIPSNRIRQYLDEYLTTVSGKKP